MTEALAWHAARLAAGAPTFDTQPLQPERLASTLARHRLLGHAQARADCWSEAQRTVLQPLWLAGTARALAHQSALASIVRGLRHEGVLATAVKGVAFQQAMTGRAFGRDHRDIDLWVERDRLELAAEWLTAQGWASRYTPDDLRQAIPNEVSFHRDGLTLDVHHALFARRYALDRVDAVLGDLRTPDGLTDTAHGFLGLMHGVKDGWPTLRHVADAKVVFATRPHAEIRELAIETRTLRAVDVSAMLVDRLIGRSGWNSSTSPAHLAPYVQALRGPREERPTPQRALLYVRSREDWRDRLQILAHTPTQVSDADPRGVGTARRIGSRVVRLFRTYGLLQRTHGGSTWRPTPSSES